MSEGPKGKSKYSATRRLLLKGKLLRKAEILLDEEEDARISEREAALNERAPPLKFAGLSVDQLQELCKELHNKIDLADDLRYDLEQKVIKNAQEIMGLSQKMFELKGHKKPSLKRVKKNADLLGNLTEARPSKANFKANLKTVKKEEEKKEEVTDWRKNVEALSGMEGRKKKFTC